MNRVHASSITTVNITSEHCLVLHCGLFVCLKIQRFMKPNGCSCIKVILFNDGLPEQDVISSHRFS